MTDLVGHQLGNYHLISLIEQGGFADVYLGKHIVLKTSAAVKVLQGRMKPQDVQNFIQEAQIIAKLKHPHIVRVFDYGVGNNFPFFIMEYAPNGTLRHRHPEGSILSIATILPYMKQIAAALQYAHNQKFIHRDIKPENLLIDVNDDILVSDFGIAVIAHSTRSRKTEEVIGTWSYTAPEQFKGKPLPASDQYALGIVVYEWLCGYPPFQGTLAELYDQHLNVLPPSFKKNLNVPSQVEQVVMKALVKDPHQRFSSVQEFAAALEQAYQSPLVPVQPGMQICSFCGVQNPVGTAFCANCGMSLLGRLIPALKPASPPARGPTPPKPIIPHRHHNPLISRRKLLVGLIVVGAAGGGLTWFVTSQGKGINFLSKNPLSPSNPNTGPASQRGETLLTFNTTDALKVSWSSDGTKIASARQNIQIFDSNSEKNLNTIPGNNNSAYTIAWSPDSSRIASATTDKLSLGSNGPVQIIDASTGETVIRYNGNGGLPLYAKWSPDGSRLLSPCTDNTIKIWDAATGNTILTYPDANRDFAYSSEDAASWSPDGTKIVSRGADGYIRICDANNGNQLKAHFGGESAVWSPDGKYIASIDRKVVQIWDPNTGGTVYTYPGHTDNVLDVAWSPDGTRIVSGSEDNTVQVWQAV